LLKITWSSPFLNKEDTKKLIQTYFA